MKHRMLCLIMSLSLVAAMISSCGGASSGSSSGNNSNNSSGSSNAATNEQVYKITFASDVQTGTPLVNAMERFKTNVDERSGGRIEVSLAPDGVLGNGREVTDAVSQGTIEMNFTGDNTAAVAFPELSFIGLPRMYASDSEADKHYFNGFIGERLKELFLERGIRVIGWGENNFRCLSTNKPVASADDLKGQKIRVIENDIFLTFFAELGANPTPMAFTELTTALQQGTVDGQDNGPILTYSTKVYENQKYYTLTNHAYSGYVIIINDNFMKSLPEDLQIIITEEAESAGKWQIEQNRAETSKVLEAMAESGVTINESTPELDAAMDAAANVVWEKFRDTYDAEVMSYIFENLKQ